MPKNIPIDVQQWSPAHDELMNSPEIAKILQELPEESRELVEKHLRDYVSVLGGVIEAMSNLRSAGGKTGGKDG